MEAEGCALCANLFAHWMLTPGELEVIHPLLSSVTLDPSFVFRLRESSSVFCDKCRNLLRETKRLHELLQTLTSQLDSLLAQVKVKHAGRSAVWVKVENECDESELSSRRMGFTINPEEANEEDGSVWVKEEVKSDDESSSSSGAGNDTLRNDISFSSNNAINKFLPITFPSSANNNKRKATNCDLNESRKLPRPFKKPKSGQNFWPCLLCDLTFYSKGEKFLHEETIHLAGASDAVEGAMRLYSLICGKSSMTPSDLSSHNESFHAAQLTFVCFSCDPPRKFFSDDLLTVHNIVHSSGPFSCSLCSPGSLTLETSSDLHNHLLRFHTHSLKPPHDCTPENVEKECANPPGALKRGGFKPIPPCRFCGFKVKQTGLFPLRQHERKEHPEKFTHLCSHVTCSSTFAQEKELLTCQESHRESAGQFKCFVCSAKFADGATLREHLAAKHTEGGVKCDECEERVGFDYDLRLHKAKFHGGEWPFKCPICGKGMEHKFRIDEHLRSAHGEQEVPLLSCDKCDRKFRSRSGVNQHKRKDHKGEGLFTCGECGKVLKSSSTFEIHWKAHLGIKDHVCHTCGKAFVNPAVLTIHLRVHRRKALRLPHLPKGFLTTNAANEAPRPPQEERNVEGETTKGLLILFCSAMKC